MSKETDIDIVQSHLAFADPNAKIRVYGDGSKIVHVNTLDNGDIFLSSQPKVGKCARCGISVVKTLSGEGDYVAYCPTHDEALTQIEVANIRFSDGNETDRAAGFTLGDPVNYNPVCPRCNLCNALVPRKDKLVCRNCGYEEAVTL